MTAERAWPLVVELRQYTLLLGRRDALINLFDAHLLDAQEGCGMRILGQFRDGADPRRFVWLRGFPDMRRRETALRAFYGGPVWTRYRDAANSTMVDSDDVLLLRPAGRVSPPPVPAPGGHLTLAILRFAHPVGEADAAAVAEHARAAAAADGARLLATLRTLYAANTFPALPIRDDVNAVVLISRAPTAAPATWPGGLARTSGLAAPPSVVRLRPTERSALR